MFIIKIKSNFSLKSKCTAYWLSINNITASRSIFTNMNT